MIELPSSVDFLRSAASATAKARGVVPILATRDPVDVATALKCMNAYQLRVDFKSLEVLDSEENAAPLVAAARILQSTSQHLRRSETPPETEEIDELSFQAAIAFAMHGNFPSARAALADVSAEYLSSNDTIRMVAAICDPGGLRAPPRNDDPYVVNFSWPWYNALRSQDKGQRRESFDCAMKFFSRIVRDRPMSEGALYLGGRMAAHQAMRLATANLLQSAPDIPAWFIVNTIESRLVTLLPPQLELLEKARVASHRRNSLLTLPTSTGKTFVAEACIAARLSEGGLCVYVAPYVAVGEQVKESLKKRLRGEVQVVSMFGGFQSEKLNDFAESEVIVATPERFDGWLRASESVSRLCTVVFDEIHILENGVRGARVEGLVSRLRLLQRTNPKLRLVGLSAVLTSPERVCAWFGVGSDDLHRIGWRPTARRLAMCTAQGDMYWIHGNDSLRPSVESTAPISEPIKINLPGEIKYGQFAKVNEKSSALNVASLARDLVIRLGVPGLIVCPRKVDTRLLAKVLVDGLDIAHDEDRCSTAEDILRRYPYLDFLVKCLKHGMAYHNASLPFDVRRDIEGLIRARKISVVCATTTLAEGADLPFRWTIVSHWLMSMHGAGTPMKSMTFRNIAGRCGRAGAFSEGDTVLFENLMGPPSTNLRQSNTEVMEEVMFSSGPLASTLGSEWAEATPSVQQHLEATFSSQLLACIDEHPDVEDVVSDLVAASYAGATDGEANIRRVLDASVAEIMDGTQFGGALAVRNSPIRLTEFGQAANLSGFSPHTCRRMVEFLSADAFEEGPLLLTKILEEFHDIPEQSNDVLRKIFSGMNHKNVLTSRNLEGMLRELLTPIDRRMVFENLRSAKSKAKADTVETMFEDFVAFVDAVVGNFLPWLLRGLEIISPYGSETASDIKWTGMARDIESRLASVGGSPELDEGPDATE
jgi:helicase